MNNKLPKEVILFLDKYEIDPPIPNFDIKMKPCSFNIFPNIIAIECDESDIKTEKQEYDYDIAISKYVERLLQVTKHVKFDSGLDLFVEYSLTYFIKLYRGQNSFYIVIEANIGKNPFIFKALEQIED